MLTQGDSIQRGAAPSVCWLWDNANMKKIIWVAQMLTQPL